MDNIKAAKELLRMARELTAYAFPTQNALEKYLKEHPGANRNDHRVEQFVGEKPSDREPSLKEPKFVHTFNQPK